MGPGRGTRGAFYSTCDVLFEKNGKRSERNWVMMFSFDQAAVSVQLFISLCISIKVRNTS